MASVCGAKPCVPLSTEGRVVSGNKSGIGGTNSSWSGGRDIPAERRSEEIWNPNCNGQSNSAGNHAGNKPDVRAVVFRMKPLLSSWKRLSKRDTGTGYISKRIVPAV